MESKVPETDSRTHQQRAHGRRHMWVHEHRHKYRCSEKDTHTQEYRDSGIHLNWITKVQGYAKTWGSIEIGTPRHRGGQTLDHMQRHRNMQRFKDM